MRTVPVFSKEPLTAIRLLSEIGPDMSVFRTSKHFVSWAGCCPRNDSSAQKVKSTRISRAGSYLKPLLVQIANALLKSKEHPEFKERYRRIKARRGHKKAIIALCHMLLTAIWNVLSKCELYSAKVILLISLLNTLLLYPKLKVLPSFVNEDTSSKVRISADNFFSIVFQAILLWLALLCTFLFPKREDYFSNFLLLSSKYFHISN